MDSSQISDAPAPASSQAELFLFRRFAFLSGLLFLFGFPLLDALAPDTLRLFLAKDDDSMGPHLIENLTVLSLFPAIAAGLFAFRKRVHPPARPLFRFWPLLWALACLYFAGEEISWGQWLFHWNTPETLATLNDQGETNLHNISSWLDQKPRALVEVFIITAGLLLPMWQRTSKPAPHKTNWMTDGVHWITAPAALIPATLLFLTIRVFDWFPSQTLPNLDNSELREFTIAWFLMLYLLSYLFRPEAREANASIPFCEKSRRQ